MTSPLGANQTPLSQMRTADPFGAAYAEEFARKERKKADFLEHLMRTLPPGVWGAVGKWVTEAVIAAPHSKLDDVLAFIEKAIQEFMKSGSRPETARMGIDALASAETSPVLAALDKVEKFLANASPPAQKEA